MRILHPVMCTLLVFAAASCTDQAVTPPVPTEPDPPVAPRPVGVYQIEISGLGGDQMVSSISPVPTPIEGGISAAMAPAGSGLAFEQVSSASFTEGSRNGDGHRYVSFTYRVRNSTAAPLNNLTLLLVERTGTVPGTALSSLRRFDGTAATSSIATQVVPTGAVALDGDLVSMKALYPDVVQVLSEAEVSAITPPAGVTNVFPVGYMVRSAASPSNRALPIASTPNQFDGIMTVSFRVPLQPTSSQDVFSFFFEILAVTDSETRLTETMEEAQDTAAVRRLRARATALGATTVTILAGSNRQLPSDPNYPGQRLICNPRTAGTAASPITYMRNPAAYTLLKLYMPGEAGHSCNADFRQGTAGRPATNVPFTVQVRAYDRYGNLRAGVADTVRLRTAPGSPPAIVGPALPLSASGARSMDVTFTDYGNATLGAVGRRLLGWHPVPVAGVTRTWTAGAGTTSWHTDGNWSPAAVPMSLDSVLIPTSPSGGAFFPALASNVSIQGVTVQSSATISLGAFDLTAGGNVSTETSGGINGSVGRLILTGIARTVRGNLPRTRVFGTYTLDGNVTAVAPTRVESGRLRNASFRMRSISQ